VRDCKWLHHIGGRKLSKCKYNSQASAIPGQSVLGILLQGFLGMIFRHLMERTGWGIVPSQVGIYTQRNRRCVFTPEVEFKPKSPLCKTVHRFGLAEVTTTS
jgi:hypothetical protein